MAELAPVVRQQGWKLGISAPGAVLHFFLSGTSTPTAVFAPDGTNLGTTLTADATGRFAAFVLGPIAYRVTLKDSAGATIWGPEDNISNTTVTTFTVGQGGTGATTFTDGGVLVGNGTGAVQATSAGTVGQVLTSTGAGSDPTFQAVPASGSNTQVIFNDAGANAGDAGLVYDKTTDRLTTGLLTLTGGQVVFPATQNPSTDANTFDDYEENTWTPVDASGAGLSITNNGSGYIKKGQEVTVWMYITYPATANGANAVIGGLPFTSHASFYATAAVGWTDSATALGALITTSATTISFHTLTAVAARTNAQMSTISVRLTITYRAGA